MSNIAKREVFWSRYCGINITCRVDVHFLLNEVRALVFRESWGTFQMRCCTLSVVPAGSLVMFCSMRLQGWLVWNLSNEGNIEVEGTKWNSLFIIICWMIWKNRNDYISKGAQSSGKG